VGKGRGARKRVGGQAAIRDRGETWSSREIGLEKACTDHVRHESEVG
jgi:hypothetical protein